MVRHLHVDGEGDLRVRAHERARARRHAAGRLQRGGEPVRPAAQDVADLAQRADTGLARHLLAQQLHAEDQRREDGQLLRRIGAAERALEELKRA